MDMENKINAAAAYAGMNQAELAREMGMSRAAFNSKVKRNTLKDIDLVKIGEIIGAKYESRFEFPDGTRI